MNTVTNYSLVSNSLSVTQAIGEAVGRKLRGGEVIELVGDVGAGKTEFVRGLARGIGSSDQVASPTFTISRVYGGGKTDSAKSPLTISHFDFYRLHEAGLMREELADTIGRANEVTVIEWSDIVGDVLPEDRLTVTINSPEPDQRQLTFRAGRNHQHLVEAARDFNA